MTNCLAPYSESQGIYKAYQSNGMLDSSIGFLIPVYENMPEYAEDSPNILDSDYEADNTKMYPDVSGSLYVRTGPSTSYEVLTTINKDSKVTRIRRGIQNGERWDKVVLENGMVGYVFQSYLKEVPQDTKEQIRQLIGNQMKILAKMFPTVKQIKELIPTNLKMEFYNEEGNLLQEDEKISSGSELVLKDENENEIYHYKF